MEDNKAPGNDGFNAFFFKQVWSIIKDDVCGDMTMIFDRPCMRKPLNCTIITLIPKVENPTRANQFRPIACCNTLYKLVSKILMLRLKNVIGHIVDPAQAGFIPGRRLIENVLLATELVKGYGRGHMTPRCMIKIDLKKAFNSIEWPFLRSMLLNTGLPEVFVSWIMACVTSVSYSLVINGKPDAPFTTKKGLRKGDPLSHFLLQLTWITCQDY